MIEPTGRSLLIVSQPTSEGVAVCVAQQAGAAVREGYEVVVACPPSNRGPLAEWVKAAGAEHVALDMTRSPHPRDLAHAVRLRRLMSDVDLVHLHSSKAGALGRLASLTMPRRHSVIFTPHAWSWFVGGKMSNIYKIVERVLAPVTDLFVAVAHQEATMGRSVIGERPVAVVPNGVDTERWRPDGLVAPRPDGHLIVCVGRLSRQKGQDLAIRALAGVTDETAVLRLIGDGPERENLAKLASTLGVYDRVEFWGNVDDPGIHLRAADVVVVPSRWEGMSLALLEAMATGAAIVASDVSGIEALGSAAVVISVESADELAQAIAGLLKDADRRHDLGLAARRAAMDCSLDANLKSMVAIWNSMASQGAVMGSAVGTESRFPSRARRRGRDADRRLRQAKRQGPGR